MSQRKFLRFYLRIEFNRIWLFSSIFLIRLRIPFQQDIFSIFLIAYYNLALAVHKLFFEWATQRYQPHPIL